MIQLVAVTEENFPDIAALCVHDEQQTFLATPVGIVARGYVYRHCDARVFGISLDGTLIGLTLVRDMDEAPACYDLQQFMIDKRYQNKGYGTVALQRLLLLLSSERRYDQAEVCVNQYNAAALAMFQNAGFADTGYIDARVPDCRNLVYRFCRNAPDCADRMIQNHADPLFETAFKAYFSELDITVKDWDGLFREMDADGNVTFVRTAPDGRIIGFIQCKSLPFSSSFFEETCGFVREFWVAKPFRGRYHGTALLSLAERYFVKNGMYTSILTTDTAEGFYQRRGYVIAPACRAKNQDTVFVKHLR